MSSAKVHFFKYKSADISKLQINEMQHYSVLDIWNWCRNEIAGFVKLSAQCRGKSCRDVLGSVVIVRGHDRNYI